MRRWEGNRILLHRGDAQDFETRTLFPQRFGGEKADRDYFLEKGTVWKLVDRSLGFIQNMKLKRKKVGVKPEVF